MLHLTWFIFWLLTLCAGWAHEGWGFALNPSRRTPSPVPVLISSPSPANPLVSNGQVGSDGHGNLLSTTGSTVNPYRYTGEPWDNDLGMYYLRARYFNTGTGRFWTMDSYEGNSPDPLSLHKYLYCQGNPVNQIDPSGLLGLLKFTRDFGDKVHANIESGYQAENPGAIVGATTGILGPLKTDIFNPIK